jgi:hypothetical protein
MPLAVAALEVVAERLKHFAVSRCVIRPSIRPFTTHLGSENVRSGTRCFHYIPGSDESEAGLRRDEMLQLVAASVASATSDSKLAHCASAAR